MPVNFGSGLQKIAFGLAAWVTLLPAVVLGGDVPPPSKSSTDMQERMDKALRGKRVGWVPVTLGAPLSDEWTRTLQREAERTGFELIIRDPGYNPSAQQQALSALIADGVDVVIVQSLTVQLLVRELKHATEAGIYVVQVQPGSNYVGDAYVGADFLRIGRMMGQEVVKACGKDSTGSHKVQIIQGELTSSASLDQLSGLLEELSKDGTINVVSNQAANWDAAKAFDITSSVIQQHPDLCASLGFWGVMHQGAAQAISTAGKADQVFVIASGEGSRADCDLLQSGLFDKFLNYNAKVQGHDLFNAISTVLQSGAAPGSLKLTYFSDLNWMDRDTGKGDACWDIPK